MRHAKLTVNLLVSNVEQSLAPIEIEAIDEYRDQIEDRVKIVRPIVTQWYRVREFAIEDPGGYVITFAQHVEESRAIACD